GGLTRLAEVIMELPESKILLMTWHSSATGDTPPTPERIGSLLQPAANRSFQHLRARIAWLARAGAIQSVVSSEPQLSWEGPELERALDRLENFYRPVIAKFEFGTTVLEKKKFGHKLERTLILVPPKPPERPGANWIWLYNFLFGIYPGMSRSGY